MGTGKGQFNGETAVSEWRWVVLSILCLDICISYLPYYAFVPILPQSMQAYGTNESSLNLLCIIYALVYVPGAFLTGPVVMTVGTRWTFVLAMTLMTIGCALRRGPDMFLDPRFIVTSKPVVTHSGGEVVPLAANSTLMVATVEPTGLSFQWLLLGQAVCAIGQPFLVNLTSEMGAEWFPPSERPLAAMVTNLMNFVGSSMSFMLPPLIVSEEERSLEGVQLEVMYLLWVHFVLAFVGLVLTVSLYRPVPSSCVHTATRAPMPFAMEVLMILRSRDFWIVNVQFAVFIAIGHAFDAVEGSLLEHYGYSSAVSSWTALSCTVGSIISTLLESRLIHSATLYRAALELSHSFMAASLVLSFLTLRYHWHEGVFVLAIGIMGLATPGWGCSCELGSEVCFPAREATVGSLLEVCSNLLGVASIVATQTLIDLGFGARVLVLMAISAGVAGLTLQSLSGRLLRSEAEAAEETELESIEAVSGTSRPELVRKKTQDCLDPTKPVMPVAVSYTKRLGHQIAKIPHHRLLLLAMLPVFGILTAVRFLSEPHDHVPGMDAFEGLGPAAPPFIHVDPSQAGHMADVAQRLANGMLEPDNYVIFCRTSSSFERQQLDRFKRHASEANLSVRVWKCSEGHPRDVMAAIKAGLLPPSAAQALEGETRKGLSRRANIGQAITHLKLLRKVLEGKRPANIFDTREVAHKGFRGLRNQLLGRLPYEVDMVKLNVRRVAGDVVKVEKRSWMRNKIFRMRRELSPSLNQGLGNYLITKRGARKALDIGQTYDTFGKWQSFSEYLSSEMAAMEDFVGFAVKSDYLSVHCPKPKRKNPKHTKALCRLT